MNLLEQSVVPLFFERDALGIPRGWLRMVRESIRTTVAQFSARRMLKSYIAEMYVPAASRSSEPEQAGSMASTECR